MKSTGLGALAYALINVYFWPPEVAAAIVNRTIDDQLGDPVTGLAPIYSPAELWNNQVACDPNCAIRPKSAYAYDGTYTAGVYRPTSTGPLGISMQFNGIAIYVFFILPNNQTAGIVNLTTANFTIDDNAPILFRHTPDLSSNTLQYQALVFSQTNLSNTLHTLNVTIMGPVSVYVNFDYAIYTQYDDIASATSSSTSQKPSATDSVPSTVAARVKTPIGAIAGGTAGGIAILVLIFVILLIFCWHRRGSHGDIQRVTRTKSPVDLITAFFTEGSQVSTPGTSYAQTSVLSDSETSITTPQLDNQTGYNDGCSARGGSAGRPQRNKLVTLAWNGSDATITSTSGGMLRSGYEYHHAPQPSTREPTREELRRERQEESDNRLRMLQQEIEQMTAGPEDPLGMRGQRTVSDTRPEVQLMREQILFLREQQRSAWARGLSNDPLPGYTPRETRARTSSSREISS